MSESLTHLASLAAQAVSEPRLMEETRRFVSVPSPTGEEAAFANLLAGTLDGLGLQTTLDDEFPSSPSVVARLRGTGSGPTLQLDGHSDTVPIVHDACSLDFSSGIVRGRGAADMKGGLAAICETVRAFTEAGIRPRGDVLITVHGMHEAPLGDQRTLRSLLRRNISGDAAVIAELGHDHVATGSRGMSIFRIRVRRNGQSTHEVELPTRNSNPTAAVRLILDWLEDRAAELASQPDHSLGPETVFVGQVRAGDFYNRVPTDAEIVGTRRYRPPTSLAEVRTEFEALCCWVTHATGLEVEADLQEVGRAYTLAPSEPVVTAVRNAYLEVVGAELPIASAQAVGNAADFAAYGVPAVYHGVNQQTAHSDDEFVRGTDLLRAARVLTTAAVYFCGAEQA